MNSVYLQNFESNIHIEEAYQITLPDDVHILLAWYGYGSYSGNSFVLFEKKGILYQVNGNHCSCTGLEGQWEPEETSIDALEYTLDQGTKFSSEYVGSDEAEKHLRAVLVELKRDQYMFNPAKRYGRDLARLLRKK